ncbi:hypothetical protein GCM10009767_06680 [Kocuria aegyptia]|uniref:Uncharacterized protein n=1 Tax=Kocuria aegyptia TaxID=330943 RepID=A0ABN2K8B3_9MICC
MWNFSADREGFLRSATRSPFGRPAQAAALTTALSVGRAPLLHGKILPCGRRTGVSGQLHGRLLTFSVRDMTSRGSPPRRPQ